MAEEGGSENPQGTDNQQERLEPMLKVEAIPREIGWYMAGFADGEGSFNVSFRPSQDYTLPWKVSLCFNISQRDPVVLTLCKRHLQCGTMRQRQDGVWYFEVNNLTPICENVIPFFEEFHFLSAKKKRDFAKFKALAELMKHGRHLRRAGIEEILAIRRGMNDREHRKYSDEIVLAGFENPQRLYARPGNGMIQSDLHGNVQSAAEMTAPAPTEGRATKTERS